MNKGLNTLLIALVLLSPLSSYSADSLSYTGRLVNSDGSPVTGSVNLKVELAYVKADDPSIIIPKCEKTIPANLTNGVFHLKINYSNVECGGTLTEVLSNVPQSPDPYFAGIRITNTSVLPNKIYSFQEINAVPYSAVAKTVSSHGATDGQVLKWDDANKKWAPATDGGGSLVDLQSGTGISVASVDADTWSVAIANLGVGNAQLAADAVTDSKVSATAAIARSKLASGTANHVLINDGSGVMSSVAALPITQGGTGATTASGAISNLGLGSAAVANIGTAAGEVLGVDNLLTCTTSEKLVWNNPPSIGWTCIGDSNTDSTKLPLAGGLMEGVINMGTYGITNLPEPTNSADAATKNYVDAQITGNTYWTFNLGNVYRTTGKVGVGTSGPASTLHVSSSIADSTSGLRVETTKVGSERAYEFAVQTGGKLGIYDTASATPRITVDTAGNIGIGSTTPQSILDISSTTSGILIPRLSTVQRDAIAAPATGLQVYNTTTNELQYFNGTAWNALGIAGSGVTSITAGTGLLGGTITSSGTIDVDVGTTANKIVQLDGSAKLPAVDGSALTSLNPANLSGPVPLTKGGTGLTAAGAVNTMLGMNATGTALEYKALTASGLTITHGAGTLDFSVTGAPPTGTASGDLSGTYPSPVVDKIQGIPVDTTDPTSAQILVYSGAAYVPTSLSGDATLSAAGALTLGTVPVSKGGTGVTSLTAKGIVSVDSLGTGLVSTACASGEVLSFDGSGNAVCTATSSFTSDSFIQNGNSFGAGAVLGTNDAYSLSFETSGSTKMTILADGKVGVGIATPVAVLDIASTTSGILIPRMSTAQRDAISTPTGMQVYNTTTNKINFHDGTAWQELGITGDGVTSITAGTGLTGGTITSTGTIAVDVGTTAGKIIQLDGSARLPAVDGSLLTNISPANFGSVVPIIKGGTGLSAAGAANTLLGMDAAGTAMEYKAMSASSPLSLTHGAGTVALDLGVVPVTKGGTGLSSLTGNKVYTSNALGTAFQTFTCSLSEVLSFNGLGEPICSSLGSIAGFVNNGNSFGANAVLGTNDAYSLSFETNGTTAMTILPSGNVGIGTTNPVQKFEISDSANIRTIVRNTTESTSYMNSIDFVTGTGSLASTNVVGRVGAVITQADPSTLMGDLVFHTNAGDSVVERMRVTGSGNVGIGTTNPGSKLTISSSIGSFEDVDGGAELHVGTQVVAAGTAGEKARLAIQPYGHTGGPFNFVARDDSSSAYLDIRYGALTNPSLFSLHHSGNLGIGTTNPGAKLDVNGEIRGTSFKQTPVTQTVKGLTWSRIVDLNEDGVLGTSFFITISGTRSNVVWNSTWLVSTSHSLDGYLTLISSTNYTQARIRLVIDSNGGGYLEFYDQGAGVVAGTDQAIKLTINNMIGSSSILMSFIDGTDTTGFTVMPEVTSIPGGLIAQGGALFSGNVGIDTGSPREKLDIGGNGRAIFGPNSSWGANLIVGGNGWTGPDATVVATDGNLHLESRSGGYAAYINWYGATGGLRVGNGSSGGYGPVYASAFTVSSDERLKEHIKKLSKSLSKISKIRGVSYKYKDERFNQSLQIGVIAQEVQKVFPEAVLTDEEGMLSVNYSVLVAPLIEAIKEQQEMIEKNVKMLNVMNGQIKLQKGNLSKNERRVASLEKHNLNLEVRLKEMEQENLKLQERIHKIEKLLESK